MRVFVSIHPSHQHAASRADGQPLSFAQISSNPARNRFRMLNFRQRLIIRRHLAEIDLVPNFDPSRCGASVSEVLAQLVDPEVSLLFLRPVTLHTMFLQIGLNLLLKRRGIRDYHRSSTREPTTNEGFNHFGHRQLRSKSFQSVRSPRQIFPLGFASRFHGNRVIDPRLRTGTAKRSSPDQGAEITASSTSHCGTKPDVHDTGIRYGLSAEDL